MISVFLICVSVCVYEFSAFVTDFFAPHFLSPVHVLNGNREREVVKKGKYPKFKACRGLFQSVQVRKREERPKVFFSFLAA